MQTVHTSLRLVLPSKGVVAEAIHPKGALLTDISQQSRNLRSARTFSDSSHFPGKCNSSSPPYSRSSVGASRFSTDAECDARARWCPYFATVAAATAAAAARYKGRREDGGGRSCLFPCSSNNEGILVRSRRSPILYKLRRQ